MTIAELLAATGLTENDLVPIYDVEAAQNVEPTQKVTAAQFAAAVKVLASLVNTTEMNAAIQQSTAETNLYVGAASSSGTTYTLTEAITNFKYIRIAFSTNSEWQYMTVPVSNISIGTSSSIASSYIGTSATNPVSTWTYITTCFVNFPSATSFKPTITYSNVNLQLKPRIITGIRRVS